MILHKAKADKKTVHIQISSPKSIFNNLRCKRMKNKKESNKNWRR